MVSGADVRVALQAGLWEALADSSDRAAMRSSCRDARAMADMLHDTAMLPVGPDTLDCAASIAAYHRKHGAVGARRIYGISAMTAALPAVQHLNGVSLFSYLATQAEVLAVRDAVQRFAKSPPRPLSTAMLGLMDIYQWGLPRSEQLPVAWAACM